MVLGAFGPDDFLIDENGRLFCTAADRVLAAHSSGRLRGVYPPERYPLAHAAPEVRSAISGFDARADLYAWASLSIALVATGAAAVEPADGSTAAVEGEGPLEQMRAALRRAAEERPDVLRSLSPRLARSSPSSLAGEWMKTIEACLSADPDRRPASVKDLQRLAGSRTKKPSVGKLLRQWLGD
jgi:hypothetical protein